MSHDALLAAKAAELTESLVEWAKLNLNPGEQLLVSLRVVNVSVAAVDPDDAATKKWTLLSTAVLDFFSLKRLAASKRYGLAQRTYTCFQADASIYANMTLEHFLEEYTEALLLRTPNFGRKCLDLVIDTLRTEGLALRTR